MRQPRTPWAEKLFLPSECLYILKMGFLLGNPEELYCKLLNMVTRIISVVKISFKPLVLASSLGVFWGSRHNLYFPVLLLLLNFPVQPALSYPVISGCPELKAEHFKKVTLVSNAQSQRLKEPLQLLPLWNGSGSVDLLYTQREGKIQYYHTATDSIHTALNLTGSTGTLSEDGLVGLVPDPEFSTNNWIYIYRVIYGDSGTSWWRLSRFEYNPVLKILLPESEALILEFGAMRGDVKREIIHTGGGMAFDSSGVLWIGTGDNNLRGNTAWAEASSSCTADLRGSILRIKPLPVPSGQKQTGLNISYQVPPGNYTSHVKGLFSDSAIKASIAPEIYAKGVRNPYTLTIHPQKKWVFWGDCGPDVVGQDSSGKTVKVSEEFNLATQPGFYGYPYFVGENYLLPPFQSKVDYRKKVLNENLTLCPDGMRELTNPLPAAHAYGKTKGPYICAITGPFVQYPLQKASTEALPPHFHNKWIVGDWGEQWFALISLNSQGRVYKEPEKLFETEFFAAPIFATLGPDGILYLIEYGTNGKNPVWFESAPNTAISKIIYTGPAITPACIKKARAFNRL